MEVVSLVGGAVISASIEALFDWLKSEDLLLYAREGHVHNELSKWDNMLMQIYNVLEDAEEKQSSSRFVQKWVAELRDLAYDVEDVLDEMNTEAQRRKLMMANQPGSSSNSKKVAQKLVPSFLAGVSVKPSRVKFNREMLSRISDITARFEEIVDQKNKLALVELVSGRSVGASERLPWTSLVNAKEVYGRSKDVDALHDQLKDERTDGKISVIPIVGMGGIGKTTLAQLVFDDPRLEFEFEFKAWVSVGEKFNVTSMTKTVLQSLGDYSKLDDLNSLQVKVKEELSGKKFLIVLDDVWNEKYDDWTRFRTPFDFGASGSIIIFTTRSQKVASLMRTCETYDLKELSPDDCLSVFAQHALGVDNFDSHMHLKDLGEEIVRRCKGLPLAAKALGGALRDQRERSEWEKALNNKVWEENDEILPSLRFSYNRLPSHLKRCFAYCAIFPEDYEFDKDKLVSLWMAEGFMRQK